MNRTKKEQSIFGWIMAFAGQKRSVYIASVLFAVAGAAFQILPFFVMARAIGKLLAGDRDLLGYLADCAVMAAFWLLRVLLHSLSTAQSHRATFAVLGNIRRQGLAKLARMPLGDAKGSGELKSILVERVDSIKPTLAHVIPEMSSNAAVALATLIYLFVIDWRMALASLITFPLGMVFFLLMMAGYNKNYARTVAATNTLNDTAVEYIGGIEVIKVFGKAKSSYEKFVSAAKECARSYIDWMNKSNFYFIFAMNIMPATLLSVLPIGGLLLKNGTLTPEKFVLIVILSMGLITVGGADIRHISAEHYHRLVVYVSQDNFLFDTTARENIRMGRPDATDAEVEQAARDCGCYDFIMGLENGFDTMAGSGGGHLSGGERQRISIARAMMKDAPIIILDEATANVDPENEKELMDAIRELTLEKTVIMIAHRLKTVRRADQILVVDKGRIVQRGTHDQLLAQDGIYRRFTRGREQAVGWKL